MQVDIKNYGKSLPVSCLTKTCPNPTTEVADVGLRLALASIRMLARSLNILGGILLRMKNMSMILMLPIWITGHLKMSTHTGSSNFGCKSYY